MRVGRARVAGGICLRLNHLAWSTGSLRKRSALSFMGFRITAKQNSGDRKPGCSVAPCLGEACEKTKGEDLKAGARKTLTTTTAYTRASVEFRYLADRRT